MLILKPLSIDWSVVGAHIPTVTFISPVGLTTHELAHMLDSLVRVSRRVERNHFVSITVPKPRPHHSLTLQIQVHHSAKKGTDAAEEHREAVQRWVLQHAFVHPEANFHSRWVIPISELLLTHKTRSTTRIQLKAYWSACATPASNRFSMQQSHPAWLVPFASLSAISGTFNSLFKVLFTFPSWYLFAIGLEPIFSLRWNLPPNLRSNPKERDSQNIHRARRTADKDGNLTLTDALFQEAYICASVGNTSRGYNSRPETQISMLS